LRDDQGLTDKSKPRFLDAWAIESTERIGLDENPDVDLLFTYGGETCAVFIKHGKGGLLLFADTRFFSSNNIESASGFKWQGNIDLVRGLLEEYLDADPSRVVPVFDSPEMPD
jgi:hypothetical protein